MRTVKEVEADIQAERQTISQLESDIQRQASEVAKAKENQEALAYEVYGKKDKKAAKDLEGAEQVLSRVDVRLRSLEIAARKAKEELEKLEAERREAYRAEKRAELEAEIAATIEDAKGIDMALATLLDHIGKHKTHEEKIVGLAGEAGYPHREGFYSRKFILRRIGTQLEQRSYRTLVYRDVFREQGVTDILREFFEARLNGNGGNGFDSSDADEPEAETGVREEASAC